MPKLVFEPTGELLDASILATVPLLADPRDPLSIDDENGEPALAEADLEDFCLSSDGRRLLTVTENTEGSDYCGYIQSWTGSGTFWTRRWIVPSPNFVLYAVSFLPNTASVLVVEENVGRDPDRQEMGKYSSVLTLRDENTGELIGENSFVRDFSDLQQVAVGGHELVVVLGYPQELHIYNPAELAAEPRIIQTEWSHVRGMAFHPTGQFLLTVSDGPIVSVWDTETWKPHKMFDWGIGNLRSVGVSKNGLLAAVGSDRGSVIVWDWDA